MIIAGDIGGTKTNVALFEGRPGCPLEPMAQRIYPSAAHESLEEILEDFVARHPSEITRACFGVAGPVVDDYVETTQIAWNVSGKSVAERLRLPRVRLINDLEATAYGVECLSGSEVYTLNEGQPREGHRALIAAGTGLGMAALFWDGRRFRPIPSEGGHVDFAPRDEREFELLKYTRGKIGGRVSYERVLSGPGLFNIYEFLLSQGRVEESSALLAEIEAGDPSAAVSRAALGGESAVAADALDMFASIYGAMAGNLVLLVKPAGGLYVGGGIAPKILEKLKDGTFMRAYLDKGRMSFIAEATPVRVILDDTTALRGAALCAMLDED
jgi:glucokinase